MKYITKKQKIVIGLLVVFIIVVHVSNSLFSLNSPLIILSGLKTLALIALPFIIINSIVKNILREKKQQELAAIPQDQRAEALSRQENVSLRRKHIIYTIITTSLSLLFASFTMHLRYKVVHHTVVPGEGDMVFLELPVFLLLAVLVICQIVLTLTRRPRHFLLTALSTTTLIIAIVSFMSIMRGY